MRKIYYYLLMPILISFWCRGQILTENFDNVSILQSNGWTMTNQSNPLGYTNWFQGMSGMFSAHEGAGNSYIAADLDNVNFMGIISNWLISPKQFLKNGSKISFYTRSKGFIADRLEVRLSTGDTFTTPVGASDVGSFTTLLYTVNPDLNHTGYPSTWTKIEIEIADFPEVISAHVAIRYYVTDAGGFGSYSDYIGIDTLVIEGEEEPQDPEPEEGCHVVLPSNNLEGGGYNMSQSYRVADDFQIDAETLFTADRVTVSAVILGGATINSMDVYFFTDNNGGPGNLFQTFTGITPASQILIGTNANSLPFYNLEIPLPTPLILSGGESGTKFWVAFGSDTTANAYLEISSEGDSSPSYTSLFGSGWNVDPNGFNLVFKISGECQLTSESCEIIYEGNNFEGGGANFGLGYKVANDFDVEAGKTFKLEKIIPTALIIGDATISNMHARIYTDNEGAPGILVESFSNLTPTAQTLAGTNSSGLNYYDIELTLPTSVELAGGEHGAKYWVALGSSDTSINFYWEIVTVPTTRPTYSTLDGNWNYWYVEPNGYDGVFELQGICSIDDGEPPLYYCQPTITGTPSPISYVEFAGIENDSPTGSAPGYELFLDTEATVMKSETYPIALEGNTKGNSTYYYTVFIDWNQNGILDDAGEVYPIGSIFNSTGEDNLQVLGEITVPTDALTGKTRMRVIFNYNSSPLNPCGPYLWGQVEDYSINVEEFVDTYCAVEISNVVEPITNVSLVNIDNDSSAELTSDEHEFFLTVETEVEQEGTYEIKLEGNTNGNFENFFTVFIDWNQNGILDDAGEIYELGSITNSTGADGQQLTAQIEIPEEAELGRTRMRIIKSKDAFPIDPCGTFSNGQAEDYKLKIVPSTVPPDIYCEVEISETVEPITKVIFAGIDNETSALLTSSEQEYFLEIQGEVTQNATFEIKLEGNTNGNNEDFFTVFIDWNQNEILDDEGEIYEIGSITNSTGTDGQQLTGTINVPIDAFIGTTRMRIIKNNGDSPIDPCASYERGQTEDYTLNVGGIVYPGEECEEIFESNDLEDGLGDISDDVVSGVTIANDFEVAPNTNFRVRKFTPNIINEITSVDVHFYEDNNGSPGQEIMSFEDVSVSQTFVGENFDMNFYKTEIILPNVVELNNETNETKKYWVGLSKAWPALNMVYWESKSIVEGQPGYVHGQNSGGNFVWSVNQFGLDGVFEISGFCEETLDVSDLNSFEFTYYPNPVKDELNIKSSKSIENVSVYNLTGQQLMQKFNLSNGKIDMSKLTSGIYLFRVTLADGQIETFKIVKK